MEKSPEDRSSSLERTIHSTFIELRHWANTFSACGKKEVKAKSLLIELSLLRKTDSSMDKNNDLLTRGARYQFYHCGRFYHVWFINSICEPIPDG